MCSLVLFVILERSASRRRLRGLDAVRAGAGCVHFLNLVKRFLECLGRSEISLLDKAYMT